MLESIRKKGTVSDVPQSIRNRLTPREEEIVQLLSDGKSSKKVAVTLGVSVRTSETHRANIMRKLKIHSVSQLVNGGRILILLHLLQDLFYCLYFLPRLDW